MTKLRYVSDLYHGYKIIQNVLECCIFNGCKTCHEKHANICRLIIFNIMLSDEIYQPHMEQLHITTFAINSANSVVPGNKASVTLTVW